MRSLWNSRALLFTMAIVILSAILVGLAPAMIREREAARRRRSRIGGRGGTAWRAADGFRKGLVVGEVAAGPGPAGVLGNYWCRRSTTCARRSRIRRERPSGLPNRPAGAGIPGRRFGHGVPRGAYGETRFQLPGVNTAVGATSVLPSQG